MAIGDYINLAIQPSHDARRAGWPMPERSGLERFRTVAFDRCMMEEHITRMRDGVLDASFWWQVIVPECYRDAVRAIIEDPVWFEPLRGRKLTDEMFHRAILELRCEIWGRLEPIWPG